MSRTKRRKKGYEHWDTPGAHFLDARNVEVGSAALVGAGFQGSQ